MRFAVRLLATLAVAVPAAMLSATPAMASVDGVACTIVGTPGPDHLYGTGHRDVICGGGGNDVIYGYGGDDLIAGGGGNDVIYGGSGDDKVLGGSGRDTIGGGAGADHLDGSTGNDVINGNGGNDVITGDSGNDTLGGADGNDRVNGGGDNDTGIGGPGNDVVTGGSGDDDLTGAAGSDALYGGDGTNWCTTDAADVVHSHCKYDKEAPQVVGDASFSPSTVDVTNADAKITILVHVTDDTGVDLVQTNEGHATRILGDVRDGWYRGTSIVPRYAPQTSWPVNVWMRDRVGHQNLVTLPNAVGVTDNNPDSQKPVVASGSQSATDVDVRQSSAPIDVTARITDDLSGVNTAYLCLDYPSQTNARGFDRSGTCAPMTLRSGDRLDGVWTARVTVPHNGVSGEWNWFIGVTDRAERDWSVSWLGPDEYHEYSTCCDPQPRPNFFALPDTLGRVQVTGAADPSPPSLLSLSVSPQAIDTFGSAQTVTITAHVADTDTDGLRRVSAFVVSHAGDMGWYAGIDDVPGTHDATFQFTANVPQGTPPGTYYIEISAVDASHTVNFMSPDDPNAQHSPGVMITSQQGDPTFTVVQHQG